MAQSTSENNTPALKLFNTLTGQLEPFLPLDSAGKPEGQPECQKVKMYVCGPTVYDDAHLGHARCYITWDVLYRFLKFLGYKVEYVRNVTDVDDKILNRAKERGETPAELAERNYHSFTADMKALNVLPPDKEPRATEYIGEMLQGIQAIMDKGAAYRTTDGSVYFRVSAKADYGKLKFGTNDPEALKKHLEDLKSGARVEVDEEKESPLDFALWKAVPLSDANGWESPWPAAGADKGWGRPGWHMECSAMNHAVFGEQIDIHAGGADLIFPHHENEIAQSEAWTGHQPFAKYWLHNGFVNVSGEKMSKSLGNFSTIKKLLERYDANTIRYFLLTNHYRMPVDFNDESLQAAENRVKKMHRTIQAAVKFLNLDNTQLGSLVIKDSSDLMQMTQLKKLIAALNEDMNTAQGLKHLNYAQGQLNLALQDQVPLDEELKIYSIGVAYPEDTDKVRIIKNCLIDLISVFYHLGFSFELIFKTSISNLENLKLQDAVSQRKTAKAEKNWVEADRIRNEILAQGYQILDNKDGTTTVEKDGVEILRV